MTAYLPLSIAIVNTAAAGRGRLTQLLDADPRFRVIGQATTSSGAESMCRAHHINVVSLDARHNADHGLQLLEHLVSEFDMAVVIWVESSEKGRLIARQAKKLGAAECLTRPDNPAILHTDVICDCFERAARTAPVPPAPPNLIRPLNIAKNPRLANSILLIGASTGGVNAIEAVLAAMPPKPPPIVLAQHMPARYLVGFAARLNALFPLDVALVEDGETLSAGDVRLACADGMQTEIGQSARRWQTRLRDSTGAETYCPSIDVLFQSAVPWAHRVGAAVLTGLGRDGSAGMLALRAAGAATIAQSENSSAAYGMPRAACDVGAARLQVDLNNISHCLLDMMARAPT